MEEINLFNLDANVIDIGGGGSMSSSVNFGPGIELLMNDKKSKSNNINIDLGELDTLERELNEMTGNKSGDQGRRNGGEASSSTRSFGFSDFANLFGGDGSSGGGNEEPMEEVKMNFGGGGGVRGRNDEDLEKENSNIGSATRQTHNAAKTWDGFTKFNEIPVDYKSSTSENSGAKLNEREKRRKKKMMIKKLEEWREKGLIKSYSHFNEDSAYEDIEDEYESAFEDKRKKDSIKLQGWWFMTFVNSVEYANAAFNPFDINLDGWGEQVNEDIDNYDEIFSELHEKYKGGKFSPELMILLRLGFSAAVVNFTNKALSSATPGFNDVIKQSPELMKMFTNATVSSMSQQSPGFAFASNLVNNPDQINSSFGPPPQPIETKNQPSTQRQSNNNNNNGRTSQMNFTPAQTNRQDIDMARGSMFREQAVDIGNNSRFSNSTENIHIRTPEPVYAPSGGGSNYQPMAQQSRQEMRGPQDIENILSGLKPKMTTTMPQQQQQMFSSPILETVDLALSAPTSSIQQQPIYPSRSEDNSLISISSLKHLQQETSVPVKRGRRPKNGSNRNIIALDI